jgi:hypothetical protein
MDEKQFNKVFDKEIEKLEENITKEKFVVYPKIPLTINDFKNSLNMSDEKQEGFMFTPKEKEEGRIDEFPESTELPIVETINPASITEEIKKEVESEVEIEGKLMEGVNELNDSEDLNKKTYIKITPTLYIKPAGTEKNKEGEEVKLYKVLNPETNNVEKRPLTDAEKHEIFVHELKESRIKFHPIKNSTKTVGVTTLTSSIGRKRQVKDKTVLTNITTNQFGKAYKKARKRKNQLQKQSRKNNR